MLHIYPPGYSFSFVKENSKTIFLLSVTEVWEREVTCCIWWEEGSSDLLQREGEGKTALPETLPLQSHLAPVPSLRSADLHLGKQTWALPLSHLAAAHQLSWSPTTLPVLEASSPACVSPPCPLLCSQEPFLSYLAPNLNFLLLLTAAQPPQHNASGQIYAQGSLTLFCLVFANFYWQASLKYPKLLIFPNGPLYPWAYSSF